MESSPGWKEIKEIASDYPITLEETQLSPGQLAVMVLWRLFSLDEEGQSSAPDIEEGPAETVLASLEDFRAMAEEVLIGGELDVDSIRSLFEMAQAAGAR
ncbi:hypothetical protein [Synechococcus sp. LTW-G]